MSTCRTATLVLALAALALPARAQDLEKVEIRTTKMAEGVYMLVGAGGNIGVSAGSDGVFLIDDQYAPLTPKIKSAVSAISEKPIRFLLNTHWHPDHTGGNENLGQAGVIIVAHDNVRTKMTVEQFIQAFGMKVPPAPKAALPVVTFSDAVTFHLNGDEIHAFHVPPAHTDGDAVVHFRKANVLHTGDLYFAGMYPFIDLASGGSISGMIVAAGRVLGMVGADTRIIPGHGPAARRADFEAYRDMLVAVRDGVGRLVRAGKTKAEAVAAKPTRDLDARWGGGVLKPDTFVEIVYDDLAAARRSR